MHITLITDTAGIRPPEHFETELKLSDWLIDRFGGDGFEIPHRAFNGSVSESSEIDLNDYYAVDRNDYGHVYIVSNPLGTGAELIIVSVVLSILITALMPVPKIPEEIKQPRKSPNNALEGQTNIARLLNRVPDIFGKQKSYPDLIWPTYFVYENNIKIQTEYTCITRGYALIEDFKNGDTLIDDITDSSVTIFEPFTAPASTEIPFAQESGEVDGQDLPPPNFENISMDASYMLDYDAVNDYGIIITPVSGEWNDLTAGQTITLNNVFAGDPSASDLSGNYVIESAGTTNLSLENASTVAGGWLTETFPVSVSGGEFGQGAYISVTPSSLSVGPITVPGSGNSQIIFDIIFPRGLAQGSKLDKENEVTIRFDIQQIDSNGDPVGPIIPTSETYKNSTNDPLFYTKIISITPVDGERYQATLTRTSDTNYDATVVDDTRWQRLAGVKFKDTADLVGTTRALITTRATDQVASISDKEFNCQATRKTVTYSGGSVVGNIETGVGLQPSRKFADALLHYFLDPALGARSISNINADNLYSIQSQLDSVFNGEKGEFSFTFDGNDTPALEEMRIICNACRCFLSKKGSYFDVTRDQIQNVSRGLFNRRNKKPFSETKSIRQNKPLDNDGVTLEYLDITDDVAKTIRLPRDLPVGDPNYGIPSAKNPLKIEAAGIRNYSQAWDRAQNELNKIIHQRVSITSTVSAEGATLPLNARLDHVDGTTLSRLSSDGEITGVNGLTVDTDQRCIFESGKTYSVILRNDLGEPQAPILCTVRSDTEFGFILSSAPPFTIFVRGDNNYQRGTLYNFGEDGDESKNLYLLQRLAPDDDFYYNLEMINYTPLYYQADNQTPPERT